MKSNTKIYNEIHEEINDENVKILPTAIPIVKTYCNIAFPLSITSIDDKTKDWFYSNFIKLYSTYERKNNILLTNYDVQLFEDEIYYLNRENISINTIDTFNISIIKEIINLIDMNKYISVFLDEYFIYYSPDFEKNHNSHESLIIGYNNLKKKFYCLSYGRDGKYKYRILEFKMFLKSFKSLKINRNLPVIIFSFQADSYRPNYNMDFKYICNEIKNYLNGKNFLFERKNINDIKANRKNKYGIDVIDNYCEYISKLIDDYMFNKHCDIQLIPFYLLFEHKRCMYRRINYLIEKKYVKKDCNKKYDNIVKKAHNVLRIMVESKKRYNNDEVIDIENLKKAMLILKEIKVNEYNVLLEIL